MKKTLSFRRNHSHDTWSPYPSPPTSSRRKSLPRDEYTSIRSVYKSEFPLHSTLGKESDSPAVRRRSSSKDPRPAHRNRDLKRKFIFDLHAEIKKPIHTITLEEISDIERITDICLGTLSSMMDNKTHRKYLHHMNNSNSASEGRQSPQFIHQNTTMNSSSTSSKFTSAKTNGKALSFVDSKDAMSNLDFPKAPRGKKQK